MRNLLDDEYHIYSDVFEDWTFVSGDDVAKRKKVKKAVTNLLRERFRDAEIVSVDLREDTDVDGDEILWITVVYSAENNRLDPHLMASFLRYLRPKLAKMNVERFPVMSYVSQHDCEDMSV